MGTRCTSLTLWTWPLSHSFLQCVTACARAVQVSDEVAKKQWTFWSASHSACALACVYWHKRMHQRCQGLYVWQCTHVHILLTLSWRTVALDLTKFSADCDTQRLHVHNELLSTGAACPAVHAIL